MSSGDPESATGQDREALFQGLLEFHSHEVAALQSRFRQVEHLIGADHHGATEGDFCEDLVRQFLRQVLPSRYSVDHGFIRHSPRPGVPGTPEVTGQLDVIVHDTHEYAPLFRSGEFVVVLPAAVKAVLEVKKTLRPDNLGEALEGLATVNGVLKAAGRSLLDTFTGVFAFTAHKDLRPPRKAISDTYRNRLEEVCRGRPPGVAIPDAVFVADDCIMYRNESVDQKAGPQLYISYARTKQGEHNLGVQWFLKLLVCKIQMREAVRGDLGRFSSPLRLTNHRFLIFPRPDEPWDG